MTAPNAPSVSTFFSGGSPAAKFPTIGATVRGKITAVHPPEVQTDIKTKQPIAGKHQVRIDLATDLRDPDIDADDGSRTLYVRGWMTGAVGQALRKVGANEPEIGGTLTVSYVGDGAPTQPGFDGPKQYAALYERPATGTATYFGNGNGAPAQTAVPVAPAAPVYDPPPPGWDPAQWASLPTEAKRAIRSQLPGAQVVNSDAPPF